MLVQITREDEEGEEEILLDESRLFVRKLEELNARGREGGVFTIEIAEEDRPRRSRAREQRAHSLLPRSPARLESIDSRCSISVLIRSILQASRSSMGVSSRFILLPAGAFPHSSAVGGGGRGGGGDGGGGNEGEEEEEDQRRRGRGRGGLWTRRVRGRQGGGRGGEDFNQGSYEARPTRCRAAATHQEADWALVELRARLGFFSSLRPIDAGTGIGFRV
jgi:hypothetical protein